MIVDPEWVIGLTIFAQMLAFGLLGWTTSRWADHREPRNFVAWFISVCLVLFTANMWGAINLATKLDIL